MSGKLKRDYQQEEENKAGDVAHKFNQMHAAQGPDGLLYIMDSRQVSVLSPSGEILKQYPLNKPDEDFVATHMALSGERIAVWLNKAEEKKPLTLEFLLIDRSSGSRIGVYAPSSELGNNAVCFSATNGFTFIRAEQGHVKLLTAQP